MLFALIAAGYVIVKLGIVPVEGTRVLSRIENTLVIPALLMPKKTRSEQGEDGVMLILGKLKPLVNPMFIAMLIGMLIGITGLGDLVS